MAEDDDKPQDKKRVGHKRRVDARRTAEVANRTEERMTSSGWKVLRQHGRAHGWTEAEIAREAKAIDKWVNTAMSQLADTAAEFDDVDAPTDRVRLELEAFRLSQKSMEMMTTRVVLH
jgi:hypothetical protein